MKHNNKGFTLVELIVSMAVLAIIMAELGNLLMNCSNLFRKGASEVDIQQEGQRVVQIIDELMIDAQVSVNTTASSCGDPSCNDINIYNTDSEYVIYLKKPTGEDYGDLYLKKTVSGATAAPEDEMLLAQYVQTVSLDMAAYDTDKAVLNLTMYNGDYHYTSQATKDIYFRNEIGSGGKSTPKPQEIQDYELICLREKKYDLYAIYNIKKGDGYTFSWEDISDTKAYSGIDPSKDTSAYLVSGYDNKSDWNKEANGVLVCKDGSGAVKFKVNVRTEKVTVAMGKAGSGEGTGIVYGYANGETLDINSYIVVKGINVGYDTCPAAAKPEDRKYGFNNLKLDFNNNGDGKLKIDNKGNFNLDEKKGMSKAAETVTMELGKDGAEAGYCVVDLKYMIDDTNNSIVFSCSKFKNNNHNTTYETYLKDGNEFYADLELKYTGDSAKCRIYFLPISCNGSSDGNYIGMEVPDNFWADNVIYDGEKPSK